MHELEILGSCLREINIAGEGRDVRKTGEGRGGGEGGFTDRKGRFKLFTLEEL